jgi:hypothetical protein
MSDIMFNLKVHDPCPSHPAISVDYLDAQVVAENLAGVLSESLSLISLIRLFIGSVIII